MNLFPSALIQIQVKDFWPSTRARELSVSRIAKGNPRRCTSAFTLFELLVVLGIMALLLLTGLPSFLSSIRASGLTDAGNQFDNMARMARENALSRNERIALILVTNDPYNSALSGRAISVWEMGSDQTWTQTSRWMFLPGSTKAYDDPTATVTGFPSPAPAIVLDGKTIPTGSYSAFIFNPEGNMYGPSHHHASCFD